jgi:hypothetical protein
LVDVVDLHVVVVEQSIYADGPRVIHCAAGVRRHAGDVHSQDVPGLERVGDGASKRLGDG